MTDNIRINLPPDSIHEPTNPSPAEGLRRLADNTPLNADDELLTKMRRLGEKYYGNELYGEHLQYQHELQKLILADRKKHELQAEIASNEAWYALGRMIDPREFVAEIGRLEFKKQELESYGHI